MPGCDNVKNSAVWYDTVRSKLFCSVLFYCVQGSEVRTYCTCSSQIALLPPPVRLCPVCGSPAASSALPAAAEGELLAG